MKLRISLSVVVLLLVSAIVHADTPRPKTCSATASALQRACALEAADDLSVATAVCINGADTVRCLRNARARHVATLEECSAVREERDDVCDALGEAPYAPAFGTAFAANFVHPNRIGHGVAPNPYLPLVVGNKWVYSKPILDADGDSAIEIVTVTVSTETKLIDGIQCRVVHDTVRVDNELVEDTDDWFAQDLAGNVWYCGEMVRDYATFDGDRPEVPELISRDGSFKAGRNGDQAGIIMFATPRVGRTYREEASWNNAEDLSEVRSVTATEHSPGASCSGNCLLLRAFSALDPGVNEQKFYAPGVGMIVATKDGEDGRLELIAFSHD